MKDGEASVCSLRSLCPADIESVIDIHKASLATDVLPNLGQATLIRYYEGALAAQSRDEGILIGAFRRSNLVGFCQVAFRQVSFAKVIRTDTIFAIFKLAASRPKIFLNGIGQSLFYASKLGDKTAEIAFIAVDPRFQGGGVGNGLIQQVMRICDGKGFRWVQTKTANHRLREYYLRTLAATEVRAFTISGRAYHILRWPCVSQSIS